MNKNNLMLFTVLLLIVTIPLALGVAFATDKSAKSSPKVPFIYSVGVNKYQANCSGCHGQWLEGTKQGPPLLHPFYKPSHHADAAFYRAASNGVRAHHWKFGNMPPVTGVTRTDMDKIIPFIRWFQKENGVY